MAFRNNSALITTAANVAVAANGADDTYLEAADGATAFVVANGNVGDDTFIGFGNDDSIINNRAIFDGNGDGFIAFGPNGVLDIDRVSGGNSNAARGPDQFQLVGGSGDITLLRFLGSKGGQFVYADASTLLNLWSAFGEDNVVEGDVSDDTIDAGDGQTVILHDNALGLNLGGDTINGFGDDDLLVTTALIFDSDSNDTIDFFDNDVLDVSGADGADSSDPSTGPGGQIDLNGPDQVSVEYLGSNVINGVTYYYYGTAGSTFEPGPTE